MTNKKNLTISNSENIASAINVEPIVKVVKKVISDKDVQKSFLDLLRNIIKAIKKQWEDLDYAINYKLSILSKFRKVYIVKRIKRFFQKIFLIVIINPFYDVF